MRVSNIQNGIDNWVEFLKHNIILPHCPPFVIGTCSV